MIFPMLIALATSLATAQTAPSKNWDARFGGGSDEFLYSLQQTADGGYILGGQSVSGISGDKTQDSQGSIDSWIVKTDAKGVKQWDARFGGDKNEKLFSLQQTKDGGYMLGGYSDSGISGDKTQASQGGQDYWIVKTDANGVKQWDARFGGGGNDVLFSLQQTADGGYILGGYSTSGISGDKTQASQGGYDYWIVKTDTHGVKQWDARFGGSNSDYFIDLQQTADGGYILGGQSYSGISGDKTQTNQGVADYWIVKTNANGVKEWDARFGGKNYESFWSLQQTVDGGYIIGGYSDSEDTGDKTQKSLGGLDSWIVKTDAHGVKQWDAQYGGSSNDGIFSLQRTADEGYILGGFSYSGISGDKTQESQGGEDFWIVKTDVNGVKLWDARFGGSDYDELRSLQQTADGGYILGGYSDSGISGDKTQASRGDYDYWIVKIDGIACNIPSNLSLSKITPTSAKIIWNAVADAQRYKLRYKITGSSTWTTITNISGTLKTLSGLASNTSFTCEVKSVCSANPIVSSDWSSSLTFITEAERISEESLQQISFSIYPNPAEDHATIQFTLSHSSHVYIKVYDVGGKEIETLHDAELQQGEHSMLLNTAQFSKGVYMVRMISDAGIENQKLIVQ